MNLALQKIRVDSQVERAAQQVIGETRARVHVRDVGLGRGVEKCLHGADRSATNGPDLR